MSPRMFIVFFSPAGSTRHTASVIEKALKRLHADVKSLDLRNQQEASTIQDLINSAEKNACLFIGSPVYRGLAVPPVMSFISTLGQNHHNFAVPFATWGGSSSGIALWQMGRALRERGFELVGAAKVMGLHSVMFDDPKPVGQGRPDLQDDAIVEQMVARIYRRLRNNSLSPLPLEVLDYQPEVITLRKKSEMSHVWKITEKIVHKTKCTLCNVCKEECPVDAIAMAPYPQFDGSCIDCLNCVRLCPEKAINVKEDLSARAEQIKIRAKSRNELPQTQAFVQ